jgi:hypothetical protein
MSVYFKRYERSLSLLYVLLCPVIIFALHRDIGLFKRLPYVSLVILGQFIPNRIVGYFFPFLLSLFI